MSDTILSLDNVYKSFTIGANIVEIIKGVSFLVNKGDFLIIFGPSGCGKSTILNMLLGLEKPSKGEVKFMYEDLYTGNDDQRAQLRKNKIGMVYQQSNWIKSLNVVQNVSFPLTLKGIDQTERERKAWEMLNLVGMQHSAYQLPSELSSGQQQRVSLARALIADPILIVADEPTGSLDSKASQEIMDLFKQFNQQGKTVIMVTHDLQYLSYASCSINVSDGLIVGEYKRNDPKLKDKIVSKKSNLPTKI